MQKSKPLEAPELLMGYREKYFMFFVLEKILKLKTALIDHLFTPVKTISIDQLFTHLGWIKM